MTRAAALVLAGLVAAMPVRAQFAGTLGLASADRYRGLGDNGGAVATASVSAELAVGFYGALAAHGDLRPGKVADADALAGFSRHWVDVAVDSGIDPAWGWDLAVHRRVEGDGLRLATTELMAGLMGPGFQARVWWSRNYDGTGWRTLYAEIDTSRQLDAHWQAYAHAGLLHYDRYDGPPAWSPYAPDDRTDVRVGVLWSDGRWTLGAARDALIAGTAYGTAAQRHAAWIASVDVAF